MRRALTVGLTAGLLAATTVVAACAGPTERPEQPGQLGRPGDPVAPGRAFDATVERVVDGDTLIALRRGERLRVRLIGVDAPESVRPEFPVECWGPEAAALLARLLPPGTRVRAAYQRGGRQDRYGRELWDVWLADGRFVQAVLVRRGAAEAVAYEPQVEHAEALAGLESVARREGRGKFGAC